MVDGGTGTDGFSEIEAVIGRIENRRVDGFNKDEDEVDFLGDRNFGGRGAKDREVDAISVTIDNNKSSKQARWMKELFMLKF